jgi:hypothetical protein
MNALLHAILPKVDCREMFGTKNNWFAMGIMEQLDVDNGPEFIGKDLDDATAQLGIILERLPVRTPWYKSSMERWFRSQNTQLIHTLPGTTFSNVIERGGYPSERYAFISVSGLLHILHIFHLDYYAQEWHEGKNCIPAKRWMESMEAGFVPPFHHSARDVRLLLYPGEDRTIQHIGIEFETLVYQSNELQALRSLLDKKGLSREVRIKYSPGDISAIYVKDDHIRHKWLRVPERNPAYSHKLSLWKHRIIRKNVLHEKGEVDIEALAEAKYRIQQIVAEEFITTKKGRGRKTTARFLEIGTDSIPSTLPDDNNASDEDINSNATTDDAPADAPSEAPTDSTPDDATTPDTVPADVPSEAPTDSTPDDATTPDTVPTDESSEAPTDSTPDDAATPDTVPADALSEAPTDSTPDDATTPDTIPADALSEAPTDSTPDDATTPDTVPADALSEAPTDSTPDDATTPDTVPADALSEAPTNGAATPDDVPAETPTDDTVTPDSTPADAPSEAPQTPSVPAEKIDDDDDDDDFDTTGWSSDYGLPQRSPYSSQENPQ